MIKVSILIMLIFILTTYLLDLKMWHSICTGFIVERRGSLQYGVRVRQGPTAVASETIGKIGNSVIE